MSAAAARTGRVLIVESRYYAQFTDGLIAGATPLIEEAGYQIDRLEVPGVFEIDSFVYVGVPNGCPRSRSCLR